MEAVEEKTRGKYYHPHYRYIYGTTVRVQKPWLQTLKAIAEKRGRTVEKELYACLYQRSQDMGITVPNIAPAIEMLAVITNRTGRTGMWETHLSIDRWALMNGVPATSPLAENGEYWA